MDKPSSSSKKSSFLDDFDYNSLADWLAVNRQNLVIGFILLIVLLLISYRIFAMRTYQAETDFANAQSLYQQIQDNQDVKENVAQLGQILDRRPELHAKYDSALAQVLFIEKEVSLAAPFAHSLFERTMHDKEGFYRDYGKTSLTIELGNLEVALQETQELKARMDKADESTFGPILYGYNLFRVAILEQLLNHPKEEMKAWEELKNFASFEELNSFFADGSVSLREYIQHRTKFLNNASFG